LTLIVALTTVLRNNVLHCGNCEFDRDDCTPMPTCIFSARLA